MKILAISGSVRRGANTEILLDEAMAGFRELGGEAELIRLGDLNIGPCRGCLSCERDGQCVQNDDMALLLAKAVAADGIILASPVYFWSISGLMKTFIDRTYAVYNDRSLRGKVGGSILVAARAGGVSAGQVIDHFFHLQRITSAGMAIAFGKARGEVTNDNMGIREARGLGKAVYRLLNPKGS